MITYYSYYLLRTHLHDPYSTTYKNSKKSNTLKTFDAEYHFDNNRYLWSQYVTRFKKMVEHKITYGYDTLCNPKNLNIWWYIMIPIVVLRVTKVIVFTHSPVFNYYNQIKKWNCALRLVRTQSPCTKAKFRIFSVGGGPNICIVLLINNELKFWNFMKNKIKNIVIFF